MKSCKEVTLNCYWFGNCVRHTIFAAAKEGDALFKPLRTQLLIIIWALPWKVSLSFRHCQPSRHIVLRIAAGISLMFCLKHAILNVTTTCLHSFIHRCVHLSSQPTIPPSFHRLSNRTSKTIHIDCHRHRFHPWPSNSTTSRRATCWLDFFGGVMWKRIPKRDDHQQSSKNNSNCSIVCICNLGPFKIFWGEAHGTSTWYQWLLPDKRNCVGKFTMWLRGQNVKGWNYNTHVFPTKVDLIHACGSSKNRWTFHENSWDIPPSPWWKGIDPFQYDWREIPIPKSTITQHQPVLLACPLGSENLQNSCLRSLFIIPTVNQMMGLTCFKKSL